MVKLLLQFCAENALTNTHAAMQAETGVALNTVDSVEGFEADIVGGHWDNVLRQVATLQLPHGLLMDLHEHVVFELLELRELDTVHIT